MRPASKVAGAASRRDPLADESIFLAIARSMGAGNDTVITSGRRPPVPKGGKPTYVFKPDKHDEDGIVTRTIWTPDWTHTGDRLKLFAMASSLSGDTRTINISLSDAVTVAALKSERGFVGYMSERMTRHLKGAGDANPTYAFIIEGSPAHKLHIHGFIQTSVADLRKVLAIVAGEALLKAKERQVHTVRAWNLLGWAKYIAKAPCVTAEELSRMRGVHRLRKEPTASWGLARRCERKASDGMRKPDYPKLLSTFAPS